MSPTVYLISGANRGIGLAITAALAARPDTVVFAGARNPSTATELQALSRSMPSNVHIVKLASADEEDHKAAVDQIKKDVGRLDVVIANAGQVFALPSASPPLTTEKNPGINDAYASIFDTTPDEVREHFNVNVVGPQVLFRATYPLLKASTAAPKFVVISSLSGSVALGPGMHVLNGAYAVSKAAVNYLARMLHFENEGLVCFPMHPGLVETDMMKAFVAKDDTLKDFPLISTVDSAAGIIKVVAESTREKDGGEFVSYDGSRLEW
ncbi:NAD(P)-binding protein [Athelia psychrophila]|uniref:NAD(P)-binding protein n=1 Tax=Athelia psychrophila TaxID=1759441 RepID=A0A166DBE6_9AGAM|nr:NAD(P)-binding protein [Fibularhizoctonia sp. CBS 109695]